MQLSQLHTLTSFPPNPLPKTKTLTITCSSSSASAQAVFETISQSNSNTLPCLRTYETDSARLSLTGFVSLPQALSAASADGGAAADEHVRAGLDVMAVETLFPASIDDHSTISTRLFLPAKKVKEKARKMRATLPKDILSGANSMNILAMTFRQVVVQKLLNFDLAVFVHGSERNMEDLGGQREVSASFALSSSDDHAISGIAEAVCNLTLETTERELQHRSAEKVSDGFFRWFSRTKKFASKDCSVSVYKFEDEVIIEMANSFLDQFNSSRAKYMGINKKLAWTSAVHSKLEKIGGLEFSIWASEHVPAYRIEIDADKLPNLKFKGWKKSTGNKWEVLLTHSQMVGLANILDMYFEDVYTLPSKQLSCDVVRSPKHLFKRKEGFSLLGFLRTTLVAATILVSIGIMIKLCFPLLYSSRKSYHGQNHTLPSSENDHKEVLSMTLEAHELEAYCSAIVRKLMDNYNWNGDVKFDSSVGAWIGDIPTYFRNGHVAGSIGQDVSVNSDKLATADEELNSSVQDIASYQVVLSSDGKVVGFQPTSRVAVNHWATNPIAKELYGGKKLSPGLLEPGLKMNKPEDVIILELLMSLSHNNFFALVRPIQ